jgi:hypothetical protein
MLENREELMKKTAILVMLIGSCLINSTVALAACPSADLSGDCFVGLEDFALLSDQWLNGYDYSDLAEMADQWLTSDPVQALADSVSQMDYMFYQLDIESMGLGLYGGEDYNMGFRNRNGWAGLGSLGNQEARLYIHDKFTEMGLNVSLQGSYLNVIGERTGTTTPDNVYIIGGHYDHISGDRPGGDDNASGTAGVLEAARVMSQYQFESTILFICFNAEEDGLLGSWHYVHSLTTTPKNNIKRMINFDMILRPGSDIYPGHLIDADIESIDNVDGGNPPYEYPASVAWGQAYQQAAADYVPTLIVDETIAFYKDNWSDHAPFIRAGLPAILVIENSGTDWEYPGGESNDYYHTFDDASDRLANDPDSPSGVTYDYPFATDIVRAAVALTAQEAVLLP